MSLNDWFPETDEEKSASKANEERLRRLQAKKEYIWRLNWDRKYQTLADWFSLEEQEQ